MDIHLLPHPYQGCKVLQSLCLYVCLTAHRCQKPHIQTLRHFLCMLHVAFCDDSAVCYVFRFVRFVYFTIHLNKTCTNRLNEAFV